MTTEMQRATAALEKLERRGVAKEVLGFLSSDEAFVTRLCEEGVFKSLLRIAEAIGEADEKRGARAGEGKRCAGRLREGGAGAVPARGRMTP